MALAAIRKNVSQDDGRALGDLAAKIHPRFEQKGKILRVWLDGEEVTEDIRTPELSQAASIVSAKPEVRAALLTLQRELGKNGGVVLEGRDVGTVVFPDAEVKIFLAAEAKVRAKRRLQELREKGHCVDFETTLGEVSRRDERDQNRSIAPLRPADDAVIVDTGELTVEQVVVRVLSIVQKRVSELEGRANSEIAPA